MEAVIVGEDEGLFAQGGIQQMQGAILGADGIDALRHEILGDRGQAVAGEGIVEADGLAEVVRMEVLTLREEGGEQSDADGAAEIAQHVEEAGGAGGILRLDAAGGDERKRNNDEGEADGTDDLRQHQLLPRLLP